MKKDNGGLSLPVIIVATVLFLLMIGFSCNVKIEIKQKPSSESHE